MKQTFKCKEYVVDYEHVPEEFVDTAEFATDFIKVLGIDLANEPDFIYQGKEKVK